VCGSGVMGWGDIELEIVHAVSDQWSILFVFGQFAESRKLY
jgi:hypothetical protein